MDGYLREWFISDQKELLNDFKCYNPWSLFAFYLHTDYKLLAVVFATLDHHNYIY